MKVSRNFDFFPIIMPSLIQAIVFPCQSFASPTDQPPMLSMAMRSHFFSAVSYPQYSSPSIGIVFCAVFFSR